MNICTLIQHWLSGVRTMIVATSPCFNVSGHATTSSGDREDFYI